MKAAASLCREYGLLPRGGHVLCAVSGGADSVCLLHWLNRLRGQLDFTLTAAHFNHGLRAEESDRDEQFVRSFVAECCPAQLLSDGRRLPAVELVVGSGDVAKAAARQKKGVEAAARELRYAFLRQTAKSVGADVIATAHNAQDNAETILLHLLRGCGLHGMAGIAPRRGDLVRPLLTTSRSEIEDYLNRYGLPHMEDSSNADDHYTRNRIRHTVIPALETAEPQFARRFSDAARLLAEDDACLDALARTAVDRAVREGDTLRLDARAVADLPDALAARAVRCLLARLADGRDDCTRAHLTDVIALCRGQSPSARVDLPGGTIARRVYDQLELTREAPAAFSPAALPLPGQIDLPWGVLEARREIYDGAPPGRAQFYLTCDALTVRPRRTGDRLKRPGRPEASLKKLMIDEKLPRHERTLLPVLECGGAVAAAVGLGQGEAFLPAPGAPCWHITAHQKKGCI